MFRAMDLPPASTAPRFGAGFVFVFGVRDARAAEHDHGGVDARLCEQQFGFHHFKLHAQAAQFVRAQEILIREGEAVGRRAGLGGVWDLVGRGAVLAGVWETVLLAGHWVAPCWTCLGSAVAGGSAGFKGWVVTPPLWGGGVLVGLA